MCVAGIILQSSRNLRPRHSPGVLSVETARGALLRDGVGTPGTLRASEGGHSGDTGFLGGIFFGGGKL